MKQNRVFATPVLVCLVAVLVTSLVTTTTLAGPPISPSDRAAADPVTRPQAMPRPITDPDLTAQVNSTFNLAVSNIVELNIDAVPEENFTAVVPIHGELRTLELSPHSVLSDNYQLLVQIEDGSIVPENPGPIRTLRGSVVGMEGTIIAATLMEEGLLAKIIMPDGNRVWIEPVASKLPGAPAGVHVIYNDGDAYASDGVCATDGPGEPIDPSAPRGGACGVGLCFAEMANDTDFEYFAFWGSVSAVETRVQSVVNAINVEYERDVFITHIISAIIVRTSAAADPYTSTNNNVLLGQLQTEWLTNLNNIPRDITQLFTGTDIDGTIIGTALSIGGVCTTSAYSFSQSDCCGPFSCTTDLHAHENGHVWNGVHCGPPCGTMRTPLACQNFFGTQNMGRIAAHRDSRTCLATAGTPTLPFFDDFPTTTIDSSLWSDNLGAQANTNGNGEPSPPNSVNIDGTDTLTSNFMDTSAALNGTISYWWQRTGNGDSPENGEDLFVEYLNDLSTWQFLTSHPGAGPDTDPYQFISIPLPADAKHPFFRMRFRGTGNANLDDWFIDDVTISVGDDQPPTPDPMTFLVDPAPALPPDDPTVQISMESNVATDVDTPPVEYLFESSIVGLNSGWQTGTTFTGTVPVSNFVYQWTVKARDSAAFPNETQLSAPVTVVTHIITPTGISFTNVDATTLDVTALGNLLFLDVDQSGLFFEMTPAVAGSGTNVWTTNDPSATLTVTGLAFNTQYDFRVKARNRLGVETPFTALFSVTTADVTAPGAPILSNATEATIDLDIDINSNPPTTQYAIQCLSTSPLDPAWDGQFANHGTGNPQALEDWQGAGGTITLGSLQPGTTYEFHVKARNPSLVETGFGPSSSLTTTAIQTPGAPTLTATGADTMDLT
ncbi:MAG: zinc-dependent metalloprotease family protein, partial [Phycisphaerae bacterium]